MVEALGGLSTNPPRRQGSPAVKHKTLLALRAGIGRPVSFRIGRVKMRCVRGQPLGDLQFTFRPWPNLDPYLDALGILLAVLAFVDALTARRFLLTVFWGLAAPAVAV